MTGGGWARRTTGIRVFSQGITSKRCERTKKVRSVSEQPVLLFIILIGNERAMSEENRLCCACA